MIAKYWEQICKKQDVRKNLSKIRQEIKDEGRRQAFINIINKEAGTLLALLASEDAKTRKNAVLLMGDVAMEAALVPIWEAYQKEEQRFIRSAYLTAIGSLDYHPFLGAMETQLELLKQMEVTAENQKHIMEEMRELSTLLVRKKGVPPHKFTGWSNPYDVVLLTNRNHSALTAKELKALSPDAKIKSFNAGLMARVGDLRWIREIRTYQELLFMVKGLESCPMDTDKLAKVILESRLRDFLAAGHDGAAPYYFRIELKSKKDLKQRSIFVKKLSAKIEMASNRELINTTENYEFEIRLIENNQGHCNILIKLFTLGDKRFAYRKEVVPTSIRPVNAALTVALAYDYLVPDAQILDPFCGTGTMLVERKKAVAARTAYGLDIQEEAILKARRNTENAGQNTYYINRDFFTFQHEYRFDEVITNMPFQIGRYNEDEIYDIYQNFFRHIKTHINDRAILVLHSHNREYVKALIAGNPFELLQEYELSRVEGTYVFVLRYAAE